MSAPEDCAFCAIVAGRADTREVLRTADVVAFFPKEPAVLGHVLVVPTRHVETIYDLPPATAETLARATVEVAKAVRDTFSPAGLNIVQSNGAAATQTVPHVHVHVVPREDDDNIGDFWPADGITDDAALDEARDGLAARLPATSVAPPTLAEDKRHHLQLISNVIERHSSASARAKGWAIAASGAAFGVASFDGRWYISLLGIGAILVFLDQDVRYLREERKFVALYQAVDDGRARPFDMNKDAFKAPRHRYAAVLRSWSVLWFYLIFLALGVAATVVGFLHTDTDDRHDHRNHCNIRERRAVPSEATTGAINHLYSTGVQIHGVLYRGRTSRDAQPCRD